MNMDALSMAITELCAVTFLGGFIAMIVGAVRKNFSRTVAKGLLWGFVFGLIFAVMVFFTTWQS